MESANSFNDLSRVESLDVLNAEKQLPRWVARNCSKVPLRAFDLHNASTTTPADWVTFPELANAIRDKPAYGPGLVIAAPYVGIDLDTYKTRDPKFIATHSQHEIDEIKRIHQGIHDDLFPYTYSEFSPSGDGVHIWTKGVVPRSRKLSEFCIEIYNCSRCFTVTGNALHRCPIIDCQPSLDILFQWIEIIDPPPSPRIKRDRPQAASPTCAGFEIEDGEEWMNDDELCRVAENAANGELFKDLYEGRWENLYESQSEADIAFVDIVAFYTDSMTQVERIFHKSKLGKRAKAQRRDYLYSSKYGIITKAFDRKLYVPKGQFRNIEQAIANKVREEAAKIGAPKNSEDALALKFAAQYEKELRYTAAWGRWSEWNGQVWQPDTTCHVFDRARMICRAESKTCATPGQARKVASAATVAAVERLARADRRHAAVVDQWDKDLWALNTPAGVIDLRSGQLRPARQQDYMTRVTAVGPGLGCPLWMNFLKRITNGNGDLQAFLQRMCGYALTGSPREEVLFFLYGTGANGKSVFLNTFAGLMGDYAKTAPIEALIDSQNERHPTELARLQGARLVTAAETEEGRRWAEAKLKQMTGGDRIAARFMRQDFFEFTPQFKLMVSGNHRPTLRTVDEAMRRRFRLVPFTVTIPAQERDHDLMQKLRPEWPGILGWAVQGCSEWQTNGLLVPEEVQMATADYLAQEDVIGRWLEERCELRADGREFVSRLWADWCQWTEANREYTGKEKRFSQNLASRGFKPGRTMNGHFFHGLVLRLTWAGCQAT